MLMLKENTLLTFNLMAQESNHIVQNSLHLLVAAQNKAIIVLFTLVVSKEENPIIFIISISSSVLPSMSSADKTDKQKG